MTKSPKLTDEERRARALTLDQVAAKLRDEYGDALLQLGCRPIIQRIWPYSVAEHVAFARERGIELDAAAQEIQREYLDVLRGSTVRELSVVVGVLTKLLDFDRLKSTDHIRFINEIIAILSHAEVMMEVRREREAEQHD